MSILSGDLSNQKFARNDATVATKEPRTGNRVLRQTQGRTSGFSSYCPPSVCGSYQPDSAAIIQPCSFPYWHMLLWGWEPIYRLMRNHPTLALARYIVTGPILASPWDYTWTDGEKRTSKKIDDGHPAVRFLKQEILPLRRKAMRDAIRAVDFGWQPFATPWEIRDGMYVPSLRALLPDSTTVLQDKRGHFAGLENRGEKGDPVKLNNLESWCPALDGEAGYAYGRSRFENVRDTAWAGWLNASVRAKELSEKISGIVPIVTHPPGGYEDDDGNSVNFADGANTVLQELPRGHGVRLETALDVRQLLDNPEFAAELAKLRLFDVQFLDAGSVTPAVSGFISLLEYWDKLLFRGFLRGERSGLEAVAAGSRADSETHSLMGAADSEGIDADLTESFDETVVFTALRLNFGEEIARRLHVVSTPLQEWKKQIFLQLIIRFASIPDLAVSMAKALDMDQMFSQMSLPQTKEFVFEALKKDVQPPPDAGVPPTNGKPTEAQMHALATTLYAAFNRH